MGIRWRLLALVLGIVVLLSAATALSDWAAHRSLDLAQERAKLGDLNLALQAQTIAIDRLIHTKFRDKQADLKAATEAVNQAFGSLDQMKGIAALGPDVAQALEAIRSLKELADARLQAVQDAYAPVADDAGKLFLFAKDNSPFDLLTYPFEPAKQPYLASTALPHLQSLLAAVDSMHDTLARSIRTAGEQFSVIDEALASAQAQTTQWTTAWSAALMVLTLVGALWTANGLARAVVSLKRVISQVNEGDLSVRSPLTRRDEIGTLSVHLNQFLDALSGSLRVIQTVSQSNLERKASLIVSTSDALSAVTQIDASTRSMEDQVKTLDEKISRFRELVEKIGLNIRDLDRKIAEQLEVNRRSSEEVVQMVGTLDRMRESTRDDLASVQDLVQITVAGRSVFEEANRKINEIPQSVGTIREMAAVIDDLAARTNLLAMNAAIEAAHAGRAGQGFSVVAEEIRKLAEASTQSSRHISDSIGQVVAIIGEASQANAQTRETFLAIDQKIQAVSHSLDQVHAAVASIQAEGRNVLESIDDLRSRSESVGRSSQRVDQASGEILEEMGDVGRISTEVTANISEVAGGIGAIEAAVRTVSQLAAEVGDGSSQLDGELQRFNLS